MDLQIEYLKKKELEAEHRMHEIVESAEKRGDGLTAEEKANLDQWDQDWTGYKAEEKRLLDLRDRIGPAASKLSEDIERTKAETGFDFDKFVGYNSDKEARSFQTMRTIPVGAVASDPEIRKLVEKNNELYVARALQSAGASAIETSFANFVTVYERTLNPVINVATVLVTATGSPIVFPRLTADAGVASGTVTAEAGGITEGDPTISSVTLAAWKRAYTTLFSAELEQDEIIGLEPLIARSIGRQVGLAWGTAFTTGNDSSEANGYLNAIGTTTQLGTANGTASGGQSSDTFFGPLDLIDAFYKLAAPYRANASWLVANTALAKMAKFRASTGEFLYTSSQVVGEPDSFLRRPVYENPAMAAVASAATSVSVGDFSAYIVREAGGARIDRSIEYKFNTDQIAIRYVLRRDGDLPDTTAIRAIVCANT